MCKMIGEYPKNESAYHYERKENPYDLGIVRHACV